jgi:arginase family enzyme
MKIHLLGLPQDNNSSFLSGAAFAPTRIREAFHCSSANLFTETGIDLNDNTLWCDSGNVVLDGLAGEAAFSAIKKKVAAIIAGGGQVLSLGGDHSVSYPVIAAHLDHYPDLISILMPIQICMKICSIIDTVMPHHLPG